MPRPTWKGHLKLSLVTCPVALYPATTSRERISFHIMNRKTGARTKYLVVDSQTDEPVEAEDRVRGYQIGKNNYVFIEDEEIESVKIDSTHTIDIDSFVARKEVDEILPRLAVLSCSRWKGRRRRIPRYPRSNAGNGNGWNCPGRHLPPGADGSH